MADACATRPLTTTVADLSADQIHHGALATITDLYGVVVPTGASVS